MKRYGLIALATAGLIFAQDQPPAGGWRRVGDPPPPPAAPPAARNIPGPPTAQGSDPEPVDRSDAYGQPVETQSQPQAPDMQPQTTPGQAMPPQTMPPQTTTQRQTTPRAAMNPPSYGLPAEMTMKSGTFVTVRLAQSLSSDRNHPGETFVAHLAQPLIVDGVVVAERGATVYGTVEQAERAKAGTSSRLAVQLTGLTFADGTQTPVKSLMVSHTGPTTPGGIQAAQVGGTTAVGAAIGTAVGWGTGAAIGAGVGAVAGLAGVILTRNHPTVLYPETVMTFQTTAPVGISTVRAPQAFRFVGPEDNAQQPVNAQLRPRPPVRYGPGPGPYGYGPGPGPYPYPYYAPYPYWGPGFGVVVVGRGGFRRW
jgi:hypothetical protein